MANIFDYLKWRGDLSMDSAPFNEIDSLILARLSYAPFDEIHLYKSDVITVEKAAEMLLQVPDLKKHVLWRYDVDLLAALIGNPRFCDSKLTNYVNQIDTDSQMQFSAITIQVSENLHYVSFRGTDDTLVGWKEDFNMSFISPVPAQVSAVAYLEYIASIQKGNLILGGHSKGGNLAVYAAAFCRPDIQDRILSVYNFDGPGFDEKILKAESYRRISERTATFVPQSSIVGMLLGHEEKYSIVKSTQITGFLQHDIYSWEVERDHFMYLDRVTNSSRFVDNTLKRWVADMDAAQREKFIDAMYSVVSQTNATTLREMGDNWQETVKAILSSTRNLDDTTKKLVLESFALLLKSAKASRKDVR